MRSDISLTNLSSIPIKNEAALSYHIDNFNKSFSSMGITVELRGLRGGEAEALSLYSKIKSALLFI
jgi:hypothetical protein